MTFDDKYKTIFFDVYFKNVSHSELLGGGGGGGVCVCVCVCVGGGGAIVSKTL